MLVLLGLAPDKYLHTSAIIIGTSFGIVLIIMLKLICKLRFQLSEQLEESRLQE